MIDRIALFTYFYFVFVFFDRINYHLSTFNPAQAGRLIVRDFSGKALLIRCFQMNPTLI